MNMVKVQYSSLSMWKNRNIFFIKKDMNITGRCQEPCSILIFKNIKKPLLM